MIMKGRNSLENRLFTPVSKGKSRALVVGCGGLCGAFFAGFLSTFGRILGPSFFDAIYAVSVGVYEATFYAANQSDTIENTWREHIDGIKLVNPFNAIIGQPVLKLEYLTEIFRNDISWLDTKAVLNGTTPTYTFTDLESGIPIYKRPQDEDELFNLMEASSALPVRKPIRVNGREYVDGTLSVGNFPVSKALEDGYEEILVLSSRPNGFYKKFAFNIASRTIALHASLKGRPLLSELCLKYGSRLKESNEIARNNPDKIELVEPDKQILVNILDCNKKRLNATVDLGSWYARNWLGFHGY